MGAENYVMIVIVIIVLLFLLFLIINMPRGEKEEKEIIEYSEDNAEDYTAKLTESYLTLDNYIGQKNSIIYLKGHINKVIRENSVLPHIVLSGPGGLGKSTLMKAVANHLNMRFFEIIPANLKSTSELFTILMNKVCDNCGRRQPFNVKRCLSCRADLQHAFKPEVKLRENDMLFLEECHGLRNDIEEAMYSLMQDSYIVVRYNGVDRRVPFPPITISGATTHLGDLNKPFRDRFKIGIQLAPYTNDEIKIIIRMFCEHKKVKYEESALAKIAEASYGTPRIAKAFVEDALTRGDKVGETEIDEVFKLKGVDSNGLTKKHLEILDYIHSRGQAGQAAIAASTGLDKTIYTEVFEPSLLHKKLIWQGTRGRMLSDRAREMYFKECNCKHCQKEKQ